MDLTKFSTLAIIAVIALATVAVGIGVAVYVLNIPGSGTVITPTTLTSSPTSILVGNIAKGSSTSTTVRVTNTGDVASQPLTIAITGLPTGVAVTSDSVGAVIAPGAYKDIIFTTTASSGASEGAFTFQAVVNG